MLTSAGPNFLARISSMSRTLAIGDVHGCLRALQTMEDWLGFGGDDEIILLGDYVNRGPDTRGVLEWLIARTRTLNLVLLRGNHDIMMLRGRNDESARQVWRSSGGDETLKSYAPDGTQPSIDHVPEEHWQFLDAALLPYYETSRHLFAHACLLPNRPLEEQPDEALYWRKLDEWFVPHASGKLLICGHTSQKEGLPKTVPGCVCIDTWACGDGWLTCRDVDTGQYWQTNQQGERRQGEHLLPTSVS